MKTKMSEERKEEMKSYFLAGATKTWIAKKYGISRERVGQIVGRGGRDFRKSATERFEIDQNLTAQENLEAAKNGLFSPLISVIRKKIASTYHASASGAVKIGTDAELLVHKYLLENNIESELMPPHHKFDILANGYRIDVKTTQKNRSTRDGYSSSYYVFRARKNIKNDCDFFAFVFEEKIWIVPSEVIPNTEFAYIPAGTSVRSWKKSSKWNDYLFNVSQLLKK